MVNSFVKGFKSDSFLIDSGKKQKNKIKYTSAHRYVKILGLALKRCLGVNYG